MGGRRAGETGVAAAGGVEVREVGGRVREEGAADEVADAAGLEGGGGLEVFEFEEDAAVGGRGVLVSGVGKGRRRVMGGCIPSCSFGESGGLDQRGRDPGFGEVGGR